jgi:hypothetical protein
MKVNIQTPNFQATTKVIFERANVALRLTAEKMSDTIEKRIFEEGKTAAGVTIGTGTVHKDGTTGTKYAKSYAKTRQKEGLQIGFIDFQRTGRLKGDFLIEANGKGVVKIILDSTRSAEIAARLDAMKGRTFRPSKLEIATAKRDFSKFLKSGK